MKTKTILLISVVLLFTTSILAENPVKKVYTNTEHNEYGTMIESVSIDSETGKASQKNTCYYTNDNRIVQKTIAKWDDLKGWVNICKYNYNYNQKGQISDMIYTKWNNKKKSWSIKSTQQQHIYDESGELLSLKEIEIDNSKTSHLAKK